MSLNLGYPIQDDDGTLRGVLWTALGLDWTREFVQSQQLPDGAVMLVVDEAGIVLARSEAADEWVGRSVAASEVAQ